MTAVTQAITSTCANTTGAITVSMCHCLLSSNLQLDIYSLLKLVDGLNLANYYLLIISLYQPPCRKQRQTWQLRQWILSKYSWSFA